MLGEWHKNALRRKYNPIHMDILKRIHLVIKEWSFLVRGKRKCGARDAPDERDWIYTDKIANEKRVKKRDIGDLSIYHQNQGATPACTAYGLAHCINIEIRKRFKYQPDVRGADLWKNQQIDASDDLRYGDSLQHALKCAHKYKVYDHVKKKWYDIEWYRVMKSDVMFALVNDNATIYTGLMADYPMCDEDWYWRNTGNGGGHCVCAHDGRKSISAKLLNSWDDWGIDGPGS